MRERKVRGVSRVREKDKGKVRRGYGGRMEGYVEECRGQVWEATIEGV